MVVENQASENFVSKNPYWLNGYYMTPISKKLKISDSLKNKIFLSVGDSLMLQVVTNAIGELQRESGKNCTSQYHGFLGLKPYNECHGNYDTERL